MEQKKSRMKLTALLCGLLALVMIVLYFMPIWSAAQSDTTDAQKEAAQALLDSEESTKHFTVNELTSPSLFAETKFYYYDGEEYYASLQDSHKEAVIATVMMAAPCIAGALIFLLALLKLPWLMLIAEGAAALAFKIDMEYISVTSMLTYGGASAGIAYRAYLPCIAVLAVLTVLLIIFKGIWKRSLKHPAENN